MKTRFSAYIGRLLYLSAMLCVLLALPACHSQKKSVAAQSYDTTEEWSTLYAPVNVQIDKPMSMSFGGRVTMANGAYIHVSMRFIGMEVAAVYLDTDSAFFVDKYHKAVFAEPLATLLGSRYSHLGISDIQNILLGRATVPASDHASITPADFVETPVGQIASTLHIEASAKQGTLDATVDWKPATAKWNEPDRSVSFKMPANYRRISLESLRQMLGNLKF